MDNVQTGSVKKQFFQSKFGKVLMDCPLLFALIALILLFYFINARFLSRQNVFNIILQSSILAPVAIGMELVILTGGIDLSVGSILAFSSAYAAGMLLSGFNILLAVLIALLIGTILGLVNGLTVSYLKIPPLIATLGMMSIARGLQLTHTLGATLYSFPKAFSYIGTALWLGVPAPIYLVIIVFILFHLIMKYTTLGRSIYAIGGNAEAARISGISVRKTILFTYAISGLLTAVGGLLLLARMDAAESSAGQGLEMEAIAAVVIGGTSLTGGRGTVLKTALGTLIYGVIINGLNIIGVNPFVQKIVIGLLILGAVGADCVLRYRKGER
jgi:ribose transport system permease protein